MLNATKETALPPPASSGNSGEGELLERIILSSYFILVRFKSLIFGRISSKWQEFACPDILPN